MMLNKFKMLKYKSKAWKKYNRIQIGKGSAILSEFRFEGGNIIGRNNIICESEFGYGTYVGDNSIIYGTKIGRYSCIGPNVVTAVGRHPTHDWVSIHPAFYSMAQQSGFTYVNQSRYEELKKVSDSCCIEIGNDVWIGASATIFDGVKIGDGAIIGAGAVVRNDIPDYSIAVGVPAKVIKYRFNEDEIRILKRLKWWDKSQRWIVEHATDFGDVSELISRVEKEDT